MIIEAVHVKNFRSILDESLRCENLTALVGPNGSGKSAFLQALNLFYSTSPKVDLEDFYNRDPANEISIRVTFKDLSSEAKELFSIYIQDGKLTVERVFRMDNGKITEKYHGSTLQNDAFRPIRDGLAIKDRGKTAKEAYEAVRSMPDYSSLPPWTTLGDAPENLKKWEGDHPDKCTRQKDDGQFFGFKEVGQGYLGRFTKYLLIPAVREASDDSAEGRGSVLTALMDLVVRSVLANKEAVIKLREETQRQYQEIMDPAKLAELTALEKQLTDTLKAFVPDAGVSLLWQPLSEVDIPMPQADVKLVEDGYSSSVARTGHGLQRAFVLTMLQHLASAQSVEVAIPEDGQERQGTPRLPNLVLGIEEPELYQHPCRQRHLASIFQQLASGKTPGVADRTQILYSTHSPLFVSSDNINQIRLLKKVRNEDSKPKVTKVISTDLDKVAESIWRGDGEQGEKYSGATLLPRLQAIMTPWMNEGFFAKVVVLVEGEDDRAAILGTAKALGQELEGRGFTIIPCGGKRNMDRPYVIFKQLGIPIYMIWDGDYGKGETVGSCEKCDRPFDGKPDPKENRRLLRLLGRGEEDWPELLEATCACFKVDLESTLKKEIGEELFEKLLGECQLDLAICKRKHAIKNPNIIMNVLRKAEEQKATSSTLKGIVERIVALQGNGSWAFQGVQPSFRAI